MGHCTALCITNYLNFLDTEGGLWACGDNEYIQCGLPGGEDNEWSYDTPTKLPQIPLVKEMWFGPTSTIFLDQEGYMWAFGDNALIAVCSSPPNSSESAASKCQIKLNVEAISMTNVHTLILDTDNKVWGIGYNWEGQIGRVEKKRTYYTLEQIQPLPPIQQVFAGSLRSLFIDHQGFVWGCGSNKEGMLGIGSQANTIGPPTKLPELQNVVSICLGQTHNLFLDSEGNVWSCGSNLNGQLGQGDKFQNCTVPLKLSGLPRILAAFARANQSILLDENRELWAFGGNQHGGMGCGFDAENIFLPTKIPNIQGETVSLGIKSTYILDCSGCVWSAGLNTSGELGLGDYENRKAFEKIENLPTMTSLRAGISFLVLFDNDGKVWTCGLNQDGRLGQRHTKNVPSPQIIDLPSVVPYSYSKKVATKSARK